MSLVRASTPALAGLTVMALAVYAVAERSLAPVRVKDYDTKVAAVRLMERAQRVIAAAKQERGIAIDARNDPERSGVIGPQFTLITTDRGAQSAKQLAAHPNFAALVAEMMLKAGVQTGDLVAVGITGSLPGMNLGVYAACRAIGAQPVTVTSVGASMFGATDPELTWLDMESLTMAKGFWPWRSLGASLGGGGDVGRGLSPAGRQLLRDAIERNHVRLIETSNLMEAVKARVALYDSAAKARGKGIKLYINVGGGIASLGGTQNGRLIPAGLTRRLAARSYPNRGVINMLAERGIPVIHLLQVDKLARDHRISDSQNRPVAPGTGSLFVTYRYNLWVVAAAAALVLIVNVLVVRLDLRHKLLGRPHPERTPVS